jgi:hypothetical protein
MTFAPDLSGTNLGMMGQPVPQGAKKVHQLSEESMAMREYALGEDGRSRCDGTVLLHVSHSNLKNTFFHELRLDMHSSIEAIKRKLEFHTGTSAVTNQVSPRPALASLAGAGRARLVPGGGGPVRPLASELTAEVPAAAQCRPCRHLNSTHVLQRARGMRCWLAPGCIVRPPRACVLLITLRGVAVVPPRRERAGDFRVRGPEEARLLLAL